MSETWFFWITMNRTDLNHTKNLFLLLEAWLEAKWQPPHTKQAKGGCATGLTKYQHRIHPTLWCLQHIKSRHWLNAEPNTENVACIHC